MLNKNDPLIGAVQEVMKRNQAERDAVNLVNEKFGVTDRKALPHEQQSAWDAAYKTVLTEGVEALDEVSNMTAKAAVKKAKFLAKWPSQEDDNPYNPRGQATDRDAQAKNIERMRKKKLRKEDVEALGEEQLDEIKRSTARSAEKKAKKMAANPHLEDDEDRPRATDRDSQWQNIRRMRVKKALRKKEALDEKKMTKGDIAALKHPKEKITSDDLAALRAGEHKMEEDVTSPSSMGIKPDYASETPDYANRGPQMVNRAAKTSAPAGTVSGTVKEEISDKEKKASKIKAILKRRMGKEGSESISQSRRQDLEEKKMTNAEMAKREKIVRSLKPVSKWEKRYPGRGEEVMYATATKQAMKEENEGFNGRHGLSVTASAEKQTVADQLNEQETYPDYDPAKENQKKFSRLSGATSGKRVKDFVSQRKLLRRKPSQGSLTSGPQSRAGWEAEKFLDKSKAFASGAVGYGSDYEKFYPSAAETGKLVGVGSALLPSKPAITAAQVAMKGKNIIPSVQSVGQGKRLAAYKSSGKGPWGSATAADRSAGAVKASGLKSPSGTFAARMQAQKQAQTARAGGSTVAATQTATQAASRAKMAQTAQSGRVGGNTVGANQQAARMAARQRLSQTAQDVRAGVGKTVTSAASTVKKYPEVAIGAAGAALTGYAMTRGNQPSTTQAATSTAQGPSYEKTGRGSAPSLPAKQPASSAASASASAPPQAPAQPVRKAAPQDSSTPAQRAQFNRQIDRGIAAPGTQYKGLGVKTGTTIKQAPAPAVKRPVGTGREK